MECVCKVVVKKSNNKLEGKIREGSRPGGEPGRIVLIKEYG